MVKKEILFLVSAMFLALFSLNFASAWLLNGTTYDSNGYILNGTNITVNVMYAPGGTPPTYYAPNTTISAVNGDFSLNVTDNETWMYQISMVHKNLTAAATQGVDAVGSILPYFPYQQVSRNITDVKFYLKPASTINITAINSSGGRASFNWQVKDTSLGYTIASNWTGNGELEALVYVPRDRNYSIVIFPQNSIPLSFSWTNASSYTSYAVPNADGQTPNDGTSVLAYFNATTRAFKKQFNTTQGLMRLSGFLNTTLVGYSSWDEFTIVPYMLEPGNMLFITDNPYSTLPYNTSAWRAVSPASGISDIYNLNNGTFNITLPGPAESETILLYVSARNGSHYFGGFQNISVSYASNAVLQNLTLYGLLGSTLANITMNDAGNASSWGSSAAAMSSWKRIPTMKNTFTFINSTSNLTITLPTETHAETIVDYSNYNARQITFTTSTSSGSSTFALPLLNVTGIKEINVFSQSFAPKRVGTKTAAQILSDSNIGLSTFSPQAFDGTAGSSITMDLYISNSSCDVPNPNSNCKAVTSSDMSSFNPLSAIIGGGKLSFRMGIGDVLVHYVNVDMLASGPPDAKFENNNVINASVSGGGFAKLMRFGSQGPTIYDYVLVSMPYAVEGPNALKDNVPVNMSIPILYDENWNVFWNTTANGTSSSDLAGNDSHYSARQGEWGNLTQTQVCTTNSTKMNATQPCYIDAINKRIWVRLPSFSGAGPEVIGTTSTTRYTTNEIGIAYLSSTTSDAIFTNMTEIYINVTSNLTTFVNLTLKLFNGTIAGGVMLNLTINSTDPTAYWNISSLPDGIWSFNVTATNLSNFRVNTTLRNVTIDTTNPHINMTWPTNGRNFSSRAISVNMSAGDTNKNYTYTAIKNVSGAVISSSSANITSFGNLNLSSNLTVSADGNYTVWVYAVDLAGNSNSTYVNITVDTVAPGVNVISPANNTNYYVNQTILISFSAWDTTRITTWWWNGSGANVTLSNNYPAAADLTAVINYTVAGQKNLTFYANDTFGNFTSIHYTINITNIPATAVLNSTVESFSFNETYTSFIVPYNATLQNVTSANESQSFNLDLNQIKSGVTATLGSYNITLFTVGTSSRSSYNYTVYLPAYVNITGTSAWDGNLLAPVKNTTTFTTPEPSGYTTVFDLAIEIGSQQQRLNLSNPAKITFGKLAGKRAAWSSGSNSLTDITTACVNTTNGTGVPAAGECYGNSEDGKDLILWTYHFSTFVVYTATATAAAATPESGGSALVLNETWVLTYYPLATQVQNGYSQNLIAKSRIKFNVNNTFHYVGVKSLTTSTATIEVSSAPQQSVFNIGDEKKFDVNSDNYYDISVKLSSISNNKANITVKSIQELIPAIPAPAEEKKTTGEQVKETVGEAVKAAGSLAKSKTFWIVLVVIAVVVVILIYSMYKRKRYSHRGY